MSLDDGAGEVKTAFFHLEGGSIELAEHHLPAAWGKTPLSTGPGFHHIAFEVSRFDETLRELASQGIQPLPRFPMKTYGLSNLEGTIAGCARAVKAAAPHVRIVGVDPVGSILAGPEPIHGFA